MKLIGWENSYLPISQGSAPDGTIAITLLCEADTLRQITPILAANFDMDMRASTVTLLHFGVAAATHLLIAPLALDGVTLEISPAQAGITLKPDGNVCGLWVGAEFLLHPEVDIPRLVACLKKFLDPLLEAVHQETRIGHPGLRLVLLDALERGCKRIQREFPVKIAEDWIAELLTALGDVKKKPARTFTIRADDGPPIEMEIPRVCCMLARHATEHSCPTCPQRTPEQRVRATEGWLKILDDAAFLAETGRERIRLPA